MFETGLFWGLFESRLQKQHRSHSPEGTLARVDVPRTRPAPFTAHVSLRSAARRRDPFRVQGERVRPNSLKSSAALSLQGYLAQKKHLTLGIYSRTLPGI
jgi:hypothetical protein